MKNGIKHRKGMSLGLLAVLLVLTFEAFSQNRKGQIFYSKDDGLYWAAIETAYFKAYVARQHSENWCWAACLQMVLDYYGLEVSQSRIVERAYGDDYDLTANGEDIADAVNGWYLEGSWIHATSEKYKSAKTLIEALVKGTPLIIGLDERYSSTGHAYVLTHVFFTTDTYGKMTPSRVLVINPANSGDMEESLDWDEFYERINTIVVVTKS